RRIGEKENRIALATEFDALIDARQKAAPPQGAPRSGDLTSDHHDVRRQIAALAPQAIGEPGAEARPTEAAKAGVEHELGRPVVDLRRVQRFDDRNVVGHARQVRQQLRKFQPRLAMLGEFELGAEERRMAAKKGKPLPFEQMLGARLTVKLLQSWLVVEQVE